VWWRSNRQKFFIPAYSENVKSAIYYFKKYDKDKGGSLDLKEYQVRSTAACAWAWAFSTAACACSTAACACSTADLKEYQAMCKDMKWSTKNAKESFKMLDSDGDGTVSFNEFLTWFVACSRLFTACA